MRRPAPIVLPLLVLAATAPAGAASMFDGTWRGPQQTVTNNNSGACSSMDRDIAVRVTDGRFSVRWGFNQPVQLQAEVQADGTFNTSATAENSVSTGRGRLRSYVLSGRIADGVMKAELGSSLCAVRWTLRRG